MPRDLLTEVRQPPGKSITSPLSILPSHEMMSINCSLHFFFSIFQVSCARELCILPQPLYLSVWRILMPEDACFHISISVGGFNNATPIHDITFSYLTLSTLIRVAAEICQIRLLDLSTSLSPTATSSTSFNIFILPLHTLLIYHSAFTSTRPQFLLRVCIPRKSIHPRYYVIKII